MRPLFLSLLLALFLPLSAQAAEVSGSEAASGLKETLTRGAELASYWEDALHSLKGLPNVIDIRNLGLVGAIELEPIAGAPTKRAFSAFLKAFDNNLMIRTTGDIIALSPPLIIEKGQIDELVDGVRAVLRAIE